MWTNKLGTFEALDSNPRRKRPASEVTDSYRTSFTPPHFSTARVAQKRWRNCSAGENSTNWTAWWLLSIQRWGCWNHFGSSLAFHFHYGLHMMCRTSRDLDVTSRLIKHLDHRIRLRLELYSVNWNRPWWNRAGQTVSVHFDMFLSHSGGSLPTISFTSENSYAHQGNIINQTIQHECLLIYFCSGTFTSLFCSWLLFYCCSHYGSCLFFFYRTLDSVFASYVGSDLTLVYHAWTRWLWLPCV